MEIEIIKATTTQNGTDGKDGNDSDKNLHTKPYRNNNQAQTRSQADRQIHTFGSNKKDPTSSILFLLIVASTMEKKSLDGMEVVVEAK